MFATAGSTSANSDGSNFAGKGWFDALDRYAHDADYPGYHMRWTPSHVEEAVAGGRKNLEEGAKNTFNSAWYTTFV